MTPLTDEERRALIRRLVEQRGLRAQMRTGSLLTGQLYIEFDYHPDAPKVKLDFSKETPELPTIPSVIANLQIKVTGIVDKIDLPGLKASLETLNKTLVAVERAANNADTTLLQSSAPAQEELRAALREFAAAARSVRILMNELERQPSSVIRGKPDR